DGDLDMVGRAADGTIALYENVSLAGTRLLVELIATKTPIGARIEVETSKGRFVRLHAPGAGVPMALGNSLKIDSVTVHWPSGALQVLHDIPINSHVTIAEPDSPPVKPVKRVQPMYTASKAAVELVHEESGPPRSRTEESMLGPGMACADVNGDGLDEVYLGGAAGIVGQLFVRKSSGFRAPLTKPFLDDIACEDLGAVFADFNADGHIDLFVVSGGVESPVGSASYRDRLYWGNSRGGFVKAEEEAVPDLRDSGGPVGAGGFGGGGGLDLFVGGRCVPGKPNADAKSRLLVNRYEPGRPQGFTTGGFTHTGRITSAVWSDIDGDASIDLVVLDETRGLSIWRNVKGQLSEHKMNVKLPAGRWSAIVPGDMDNDGAMDYGLMNLSGESGVLKNDGAGRFEWVALPVLSQWSPARSAHWLDADGDGRQDLFMVQNLPAAAWPEAPRGGGVGQAFRGMPGGGFEAWAPRESGFVAPGVASAFVLTDLNNDHAPDFLIARNDQPMYALERNPSSSKWLTIRFHGPHRNIMAIGTRVAIDWNGRLKLLAELYGGSGYLTQSANRVFFPRPSSDGQGMIKVYWPDGTRSQMSFSRKEPSVIIRHKG
ncbi:MAG: FG-GAP-like repeat-containing protein, partial [Verrucomicrobiales bacterium]